MKKLNVIWVIILFMFPCHFVFAGLVINEIMYDLSGSDSTTSKSREWIEIYNPDAGSVSIDATKWRIYDGSANRTINGEVNFSIPSGAYIIFAGDKDTFLVDHAGFTGIVYDTGITSLNNTGATLKILDQDLNVVDSVTYASTQDGAGDGNSLQKISGSWVGATPTSGITNETTTPPTSSSTSTSGETSNGGGTGTSATVTTNQTETKSKSPEVKKIKTRIISDTNVFSGIPFSLQATALGYSGESLTYGRYFWNFGDGDSKEVQASSNEKFTHTYFYPGEYQINLEYYLNYSSLTPDASDQIIVRVVGADVVISSVGTEKDFFVELANNTDYDVNLSKWILLSEKVSFTIPKNTILMANRKLIISSRLTGFSMADKNTLKLMTSEGEVAFDYRATLQTPSESPPQPLLHKDGRAPSPPNVGGVPKGGGGIKEGSIEILPKSLQASAISSDAFEENPSSFPYMPVSAGVIFIGASAGAAYFIRQKRIIPKAGDDFQILDE